MLTRIKTSLGYLLAGALLFACSEGRLPQSSPDAAIMRAVDAAVVDAAVADAAVPDTGASAIALLLGESAEGEIAEVGAGVDYAMPLQAGDMIRLSILTLQGDLRPAAYLGSPSGFVEPETYVIDGQRVDLDYLITASATYTIEVRAHRDQGTGRYRLETQCSGGTCDINTDLVDLRVLAINDFHGYLEAESSQGGGAWLSAHVQQLRQGHANTIFVSAGDLIGASPYISARFHDEATIELMNHMGLDLNAVGNHEFDEGLPEIERLQSGGCHPVDLCQGRAMYPGAEFEILGANVVLNSGAPALPKYVVREFDGVPVAFIGMTLEGTPAVTVAARVSELDFLDEVETVRALVPELQGMGIEAIVVILHQGGVQDGGPNQCENIRGRIVQITAALDDAVDLVLSGHSHRTYNCTIDGKALTSAGSAGRYVTAVDLKLSRVTKDVVQIQALNVPVDRSIAPDPVAETIIRFYKSIVDTEVNAVVGTLAGPLSAGSGASNGLSTLGLAIADSQLFATRLPANAQVAFMNRGGIRASLPQGNITFGQAFATQPFENILVTMTLSGSRLEDLLRSQFAGNRFAVLQPSQSLRYDIENVGGSIRFIEGSASVDGAPVDPQADYRITVNDFLAGGGDGFTIFLEGTQRTSGIVDFRAFIEYLEYASPLPVPRLDRIEY